MTLPAAGTVSPRVHPDAPVHACPACATLNRYRARYCKGCHAVLPVLDDPFVGLHGHDNIAALLRDDFAYALTARAVSTVRMPRCHQLIIGSVGSGTTTLAYAIARLAQQVGLVKEPPLLLTARHLQSAKPNDLLAQHVDRTLILDDVDTLVAFEGQGKESGRLTGDMTLLRFLQELDQQQDGARPLVLVTGTRRAFSALLQADDGLVKHFGKVTSIADWTPGDVREVTSRLLADLGWKVPEDVAERLTHRARSRIAKAISGATTRESDASALHGHLANYLAKAVSQSALRRLGASRIDGELAINDVEGEIEEPQSVEELFAKLEAMPGLAGPVADLKQMLSQAQENRAKSPSEPALRTHLRLLGNPGTGKTMLARLLGRILFQAGILPTERFIEVSSPGNVVGRYLGESEANMNDCIDRAIGGVLFLDEAHQFADKNLAPEYVQAALKTLMPRLENERGKFLCILAGYPGRLDELNDLDPGFASRFGRSVALPDYTTDQLVGIAERFAAIDGKRLAEDARPVLRGVVSVLRTWRSDEFANARGARLLVDSIGEALGERCRNDPTADPLLILRQDIALPRLGGGPPRATRLAEVEAELSSLHGQPEVQSALRRFRSAARDYAQQLLAGEEPESPLKHVTLAGNPGTGKTTVARLIGGFLYGLGLLPRDITVEAKGADLTTAERMQDLLRRSMGGVLFIDEIQGMPVYAGDQNLARGVLVPALLNDKGRFVAVVASYPQEVESFLSSDPGFSRRFGLKLRLQDFTPEAIHAITVDKAERKHRLALSDDASQALLSLLRQPATAQARTNQNAGLADTMVAYLSDMVAQRRYDDAGAERAGILRRIELEDIPCAIEPDGTMRSP